MSSVTDSQADTVDREPSSLPRMTYEEFLAWPHENQHVEWVNGRVVSMPPVGTEHGSVAVFLTTLLNLWVGHHHAGAVYCEPVSMKTAPTLPGRSPDVLFVSTANLARVKKSYVDGPADLVVEVISPDSRARDLGEKFAEYEQGGVREYWVIDPERKQALFYQLGGDGNYRLVAPDARGIYESAVLPGLWLKVDWLWQRPLPPVIDVLREWKLV
jgi:Uma2 family endonuclease